MQEVAELHGFEFEVKPRRRRSWLKDEETGASIYRTNSAKILGKNIKTVIEINIHIFCQE